MVPAGVLGLVVLVVGASAQGLFMLPRTGLEDMRAPSHFMSPMSDNGPDIGGCRMVLPGLVRCVRVHAQEDPARVFPGHVSDSDDDSDMELGRRATVIVRAGPPVFQRPVITLQDVLNGIRARAGLPPIRVPESSPEQSREDEVAVNDDSEEVPPMDESEEQPKRRVLIVMKSRPEITGIIPGSNEEDGPKGITVRHRTVLLVGQVADSSESKDSDEDADDTTSDEPMGTTSNYEPAFGDKTTPKTYPAGPFETTTMPTTGPTEAPTTKTPFWRMWRTTNIHRFPPFDTTTMPTTGPTDAPTTNTPTWRTLRTTNTPATTGPTTTSESESPETTTYTPSTDIDTSTSFETTTPRMKMLGTTESESREELDMPEDVEILQRRTGIRQRLGNGLMDRFKYQPVAPAAMHV